MHTLRALKTTLENAKSIYEVETSLDQTIEHVKQVFTKEYHTATVNQDHYYLDKLAELEDLILGKET